MVPKRSSLNLEISSAFTGGIFPLLAFYRTKCRITISKNAKTIQNKVFVNKNAKNKEKISKMPCSHLQTVMNKGHEALDAYKTIHANLITPWTNAGLERKAKASQCFMPLSNHSMPMDAYKKLHACLHCIHVACQAHRNSHSLKKSHPLSVELVYGNVYCQECNDYVYDSEFEAVSDAFSTRASKSLGHGSRYHPWRPSPSEISLLKTHKKRKGVY